MFTYIRDLLQAAQESGTLWLYRIQGEPVPVWSTIKEHHISWKYEWDKQALRPGQWNKPVLEIWFQISGYQAKGRRTRKKKQGGEKGKEMKMNYHQWQQFSLKKTHWEETFIVDITVWNKVYVLYWLVLCQHSWSYHRKRSFSWGNASMRSNCKAFSQLVIKGERPLVGGTISGLVVLVL